MPLPPYTVMRDGKMYVRLRYRAGGKWKAKERQVANAREAVTALAEMKAELSQYGVDAYDAERMTFDQVLAEFRRAKPDLPEHVIAPMDYFLGRRIRSIGYADLVLFAQKRREVPNKLWVEHEARKARLAGTRAKVKEKHVDRQRKPATIHRELEVVRQLMLFALRHGWILRNPFAAGPPLIVKSQETRRERLPTREEEARLLAACEDPLRRHLALYIIATRDTGLRFSALRELTWGCVDWDRNTMRVPEGNRHKKRPRILGLTVRLREALLTYHAGSSPGPTTSLLPPVGCIKRSWHTACRLAGIEELRLNDLRHGYATDLMEAGLPQHYAMKLAGHATADIHDIYTNVDERMAREAAEALSRLHQHRPGYSPSLTTHSPFDGEEWQRKTESRES